MNYARISSECLVASTRVPERKQEGDKLSDLRGLPYWVWRLEKLAKRVFGWCHRLGGRWQNSARIRQTLLPRQLFLFLFLMKQLEEMKYEKMRKRETRSRDWKDRDEIVRWQGERWATRENLCSRIRPWSHLQIRCWMRWIEQTFEYWWTPEVNDTAYWRCLLLYNVTINNASFGFRWLDLEILLNGTIECFNQQLRLLIENWYHFVWRCFRFKCLGFQADTANTSDLRPGQQPYHQG